MTITDGVRAFVDGAGLLRRGDLARYIWWPALVSAVIVAIGLWGAFTQAQALGDALVNGLPDWLDFLSVILVPLLYVLAILVGTWLFGFVAIVVSSPFHSNLSAALEGHLEQAPANPAQPQPMWADALASLRREARKLGYQLPRLVGILLLSFVPLINIVSPLLWLLFGAWMLTVQFADLPAENRQHTFLQTLELLRQNRGAALGFGLCVTPLLAVPIVNFVVVPIAVAGGTVLWHRMRADSLTQSI